MKNILKKAFTDTVPVMTGYLILGMGFGVLFSEKGYGLLWSLAASALIFAGSMQYVAIDLIAGGAGLITAALTTLMVNARHLFYGISMVDKYKDVGKAKPYLIFALTDETYSLVCHENSEMSGRERRRYYFLVSLFDHCWWVSGSVMGAALGPVIPFDTTGIDFAMTALFVTVFTDQWLGTKDHLSAIIGVGASVLCLLIFGSEAFLIPAMLLITALLTAMKYIRRENNG